MLGIQDFTKVPVLRMLQQEYGEGQSHAQPTCTVLHEGALVASLARSVEGARWEETARKRYPLPSASISWSQLLSLSQSAIRELNGLRSTADEKVLLLLSKAALQDNDRDAINAFFELSLQAVSVSFSKCAFVHPEAAISVLGAVTAFLDRDEAPPKWEKLFIFQAMTLSAVHGSDSPRREDEADAAERKEKFARMVQDLCRIIVNRPLSALWWLDNLAPGKLNAEDRHVAVLLKAALDVKGCLRILRSGNRPYRFFWPRLTWVERHMRRAEMLGNFSLVNVRDAVDSCSLSCMVGCAKLWLAALYPGGSHDSSYWVKQGGLSESHTKELFSQVDSALCGLLLMSCVLPGLVCELRGLMKEATWDFPKVSEILQEQDEDVGAAASQAIEPAVAHRKGIEQDRGEASQGKGRFKGKGKRRM